MGLNKNSSESLEDYDNRMVHEYCMLKNFKESHDEKKKYNLNEIIMQRLLTDDSVFNGLENETYLRALQHHWRFFTSCDDLPPRRGSEYRKN